MYNLQASLLKVDIVMCIDATAAMTPILDTIKANALSFGDTYISIMEEKGRPVSNLRVKVIVFRDYGCDAEPMTESAFFDLPAQKEVFEAFVKAITPGGGGDGPENALEAIALAMKADWVEGGVGIKRRHYILLFSDAPALELGARASCPNYPVGMPKDLSELSKWWHGTEELAGFDVKSSRLIAFVPDSEPWTTIAEWDRAWIAYCRIGTGLSEVDMGQVYELLTAVD